MKLKKMGLTLGLASLALGGVAFVTSTGTTGAVKADAVDGEAADTVKVSIVIDGEVENCVLSKGVYIGKGAKISNCIVMQDTKIGQNTNLNYVIIDKDVTIKDGRSLMGFDSYPIYIAKKSVV